MTHVSRMISYAIILHKRSLDVKIHHTMKLFRLERLSKEETRQLHEHPRKLGDRPRGH